ncbi:MAG: archease, partial [Dehalococcoidia bacterium]
TSEVGILAQGESLAEAFTQAALGLFSFMTDLSQVQERESRRVEVAAPDLDALLIEWLNELLYCFEVEDLLFRRFEIPELHPTGLQALCYGERYDPARHRIEAGIKAATYYMVEVRQGPPWEVQVYLDI